MRKQISFEQVGPQTCLLNIKNVFGFSINYVEDKIKKHNGRWDRRSRKFQVPLPSMPELAKELRQIDRSFHIQQVPSTVTEMLSRYSHSGNKIKKQLLIDSSFAQRYSNVEGSLIKNIVSTCQGPCKTKYYDKILIVTMECKVLSWIDFLPSLKVRRLKFQEKQCEIALHQSFVWICSYDILWEKSEHLNKYCFQTIIIDEAQNFAQKLNSQNEAALSFRKFLASRHFVFPIIAKLYLNNFAILLPLLSLILPQTNLQWFTRRYKKQNISELNFILKTCCLYRFLNGVEKKQASFQHYFNKWVLPVSEQCIERIKMLNKKSSQVQQRKILEDLSNARNKNQRLYVESLQDTLRQQKIEQVYKTISYFCLELNIKLAVIMQTSSMYRSIENFLCERQISYCHYQHHQQVLEFNKNPTILVCLVKTQYLSKLSFSNPLRTKDEIVNLKLDSYDPQQYLCLSGVNNILFPDIQWVTQVKSKQESIRRLLRHIKTDIARHYFILKGTYEQKWMKQLEQILIKIQMNIKIKQDLQEEEDDEEGEGNDDPVQAFSQLNMARTQQEYSHLKVIKGVTDIDEEFDRLEFEALQQKLEKQSKKKKKEEKARQKLFQRATQVSPISSPKIGKALPNKQDKTDCQKVENEQQQKKSFRNPGTRTRKMEIYEPSEINMCQLPRKKEIADIKNEAATNLIGLNQLTKIMTQVSESSENTLVVPVLESGKQIFRQQEEFSNFKQVQTQEAEIIEVRKPPPRPKIPKQKSQRIKVILHPSVKG